MKAGTYRARVHWVDRKTGLRGVWTEPETTHGSLWDDSDDVPGLISTFQWSENNYSCDCNRARFFVDEDWEGCVDPEFPRERFVITKLEALNAAGDLVADLEYDESTYLDKIPDRPAPLI